MLDTRAFHEHSFIRTNQVLSFCQFLGYEPSPQSPLVLLLSYDKGLDRLMACRESLLYQIQEFRFDDNKYDFHLNFELKYYK